MLSLSAVSLFLASVSAQTLTGQFDCLEGSSYLLCQNLWGAASGTGSQSSTLIKAEGNTISWSTNWTWSGNENAVKSYANVESNASKGVQLANVTSAPTRWTWNYESRSNAIRADVAYDIWTGVQSVGAPASANSSYELMIWLSKLGSIQPVGSQVTTGTQIAGYTWDVWRGPNTNWQVISFVGSTEITDFNVDLKDFFGAYHKKWLIAGYAYCLLVDYVVAQQGVASTQYIQSIQAGTEPFTGNANLVTANYSVSIV